MSQETESSRESLLYEIIERELVMFLATPNEGGVASCQMHPDAFRAMRRMTHSVHDEATLRSYLHDLRLAAESGRNFMIEKYARMDDRLPPLSSSPLLDEIADAETAFLEDAAARFPHVIKRNVQKFQPIKRQGQTVIKAAMSCFGNFFCIVRVRNVAVMIFDDHSLPGIISVDCLFFLLPSRYDRIFV